jgi:hypothetical protein
VCDSANTLQQFEAEDLDGQLGRIRDKASGRCLSVKNCELETGGGSNDDRTCVAVATGKQPCILMLIPQAIVYCLPACGHRSGPGRQLVTGRHADCAKHGSVRPMKRGSAYFGEA